MMTGYPNLENAVEALNYDADAYLIKPVNFERLITVVKEKLAKQREEEAITLRKSLPLWRQEPRECFKK